MFKNDSSISYNEALKALEKAHSACYKHPDRDVLGMSHGDFSGVNVALGIIKTLENENNYFRSRNREKYFVENYLSETEITSTKRIQRYAEGTY